MLVPTIAEECGIPSENVIDLFTAMGGRDLSQPELYCVPDACDYFHPNEGGHLVMAKTIYKAIFGVEIPEMPKDYR